MASLNFNYDKGLGCYVSDATTLSKGGILATLAFENAPGGYIEVQKKNGDKWNRVCSVFAKGLSYSIQGDMTAGSVARVLAGNKPISSSYVDVTPGTGGGGSCDCIIHSVSSDFDLSSGGELSLYKQMAINSFSGGSTVEKGSSVAKVNLSWSLNKVPESLTLDGSAINRDSTSKEVTGPFTADKTFTLKATDARGVSKSATTSISFKLKKYWGVSNKATLTSADVLALGKSDWANSKAMSAQSFDCTGGKYPYYCLPSSLGTPEFWVGGLKNSNVTTKQLSVTNASGHTETYNIFRLTDIQNGKLSIEFK